jgi:hypothetical protein
VSPHSDRLLAAAFFSIPTLRAGGGSFTVTDADAASTLRPRWPGRHSHLLGIQVLVRNVIFVDLAFGEVAARYQC